jgi:hypothetical protein
MTATAINELRELAHRTSDGIEVTMFWTKRSNRVTIVVVDTRFGGAVEFEVAGSTAIDAFNHPYAYAPGDSAVSHVAAGTLAASTDR